MSDHDRPVTITPLDLDAIRARANRGKLLTQGFIAADVCRTDIPALCAEVERLRSENAEYAADESERNKLLESIRDDARKALHGALGKELWAKLWGPELEALGYVVYACWMDRQRAIGAVKCQQCNDGWRQERIGPDYVEMPCRFCRRIAALEKRCAELEAGLRPFAKLADVPEERGMIVCREDCRKAAALLAAKEGT